ncbi:SLC22A23 [Acanthosepion pharaonis]|uniref:SLC22A23 n=1 Tax=Acanthosepion pharaonis TaxID=158019 RepID=A0A812EWC2_ACAPH|nr:SLC22A23 [Sepia pharaonis]
MFIFFILRHHNLCSHFCTSSISETDILFKLSFSPVHLFFFLPCVLAFFLFLSTLIISSLPFLIILLPSYLFFFFSLSLFFSLLLFTFFFLIVSSPLLTTFIFRIFSSFFSFPSFFYIFSFVYIFALSLSLFFSSHSSCHLFLSFSSSFFYSLHFVFIISSAFYLFFIYPPPCRLLSFPLFFLLPTLFCSFSQFSDCFLLPRPLHYSRFHFFLFPCFSFSSLLYYLFSAFERRLFPPSSLTLSIIKAYSLLAYTSVSLTTISPSFVSFDKPRITTHRN